MNLTELAALRLQNQRLTRGQLKSPREVMDDMLAVQAQEYPGPLWTLGLRLQNPGESGVQAAFQAHDFIRTWVMRSTLHFVNAADAGWLVKLVGPRVIAMSQRRYRELELDEATLRRACELLPAALAEKGPQSRPQLLAMLEENGIVTSGQRAPYLLARASLEGLVCQVDVLRNQPVYALSSAVLPAGRDGLEGEAALAELAIRYFRSRGPATLHDFAWWAGLPMAQCRAGLEAVKGRLESVEVEGQTLWHAPGAEPGEQRGLCAHLLPTYDEFLIAYEDRGAMLDPADKMHIAQGNGLSATVELDGRIVGKWRRSLRKESVQISIWLFRDVDTQGREAIAEAARRYGEFLGLSAQVEYE